MKLTPKIVEVCFSLNGQSSKSVFNLFDPVDLAIWKANEKLTKAITCSVKVIKQIEINDKNTKKLLDAKEKSLIIFDQLKKGKDL